MNRDLKRFPPISRITPPFWRCRLGEIPGINYRSGDKGGGTDGPTRAVFTFLRGTLSGLGNWRGRYFGPRTRRIGFLVKIDGKMAGYWGTEGQGGQRGTEGKRKRTQLIFMYSDVKSCRWVVAKGEAPRWFL